MPAIDIFKSACSLLFRFVLLGFTLSLEGYFFYAYFIKFTYI